MNWVKRILLVLAILLCAVFAYFVGDYYYVHRSQSYLSDTQLMDKYFFENYMSRYPNITVKANGENLTYIKQPRLWYFNRFDNIMDVNPRLHGRLEKEIPINPLKRAEFIEIMPDKNMKILHVGTYQPISSPDERSFYGDENLLLPSGEKFKVKPDKKKVFYYILASNEKHGIMEYLLGVEFR